jgi:hypothetical protein
MSGFSVDWLTMREPYDHAARSVGLVAALAGALPKNRPVELLELAVGCGSGPRFVAPRLGGRQHWTVVDHDQKLLDALIASKGHGPLADHSVQTQQRDLRDLGALDVPTDAVFTQALLDLVSQEWLEGLADWLADRRVPFLAALTVDGRVKWHPTDDRDAEVQTAFRAHQLGDRGFGASPGYRAGPAMAALLSRRGFKVSMERADWQILPDATEMLGEMARGMAHAASEAAEAGGTTADRVEAWRSDRLSEIADGSVSLEIGHLDLLALP